MTLRGCGWCKGELKHKFAIYDIHLGVGGEKKKVKIADNKITFILI